MKIVVVGGSGPIGSKLVATLSRDGHEVVAASRRSGFDAVPGKGLAEALAVPRRLSTSRTHGTSKTPR